MLKKWTLRNFTRVASVFLVLGMMPIVSAQSAAIGGSRIAAVNSEKILRDSMLAKLAQERLERQFAQRDKALQKMAEKLKKMSEDLDKHGASMSVSQRVQKQNQLSQFDLNFQRKQREFRDDLNQSRNEELTSLLAQANQVIKQIAQQQHYDLIVQEAVYVSPNIDITDQVIKALDASVKK